MCFEIGAGLQICEVLVDFLRGHSLEHLLLTGLRPNQRQSDPCGGPSIGRFLREDHSQACFDEIGDPPAFEGGFGLRAPIQLVVDVQGGLHAARIADIW